ncbi:MAG: four helix bundle protein [Bacteroidetes bacterium]|nr:four helix bundle protein [Bacteroidota bacterium]
MRKHNFKNLEVWKKSRKYVAAIYSVSAKFPSEERFGVIAQIRSAVISISLNISEGSGRGTNKDFSRFLDMSYGSALEVENLLYLSFDLKFITEDEQNKLVEQVNEIQKMINGLQDSLNG